MKSIYDIMNMAHSHTYIHTYMYFIVTLYLTFSGVLLNSVLYTIQKNGYIAIYNFNYTSFSSSWLCVCCVMMHIGTYADQCLVSALPSTCLHAWWSHASHFIPSSVSWWQTCRPHALYCLELLQRESNHTIPPAATGPPRLLQCMILLQERARKRMCHSIIQLYTVDVLIRAPAKNHQNR